MKKILSGERFTEAAVFSATGILCLLLAFNLNFGSGKQPGAGVFASDKSIYYVYLPATFIYGWDAKRFPDRCDTLYRGFVLDTSTNTVRCKMTCGVAVLWTPFFLLTHAVAAVTGGPADGFSGIYPYAALVPPVVFLVLGLFFLRRFLARYFARGTTWATVLLLLTGTNLLYYATADGLMSHVHSFFLFSLCLWLLQRFFDGGMRSGRLFALISLVISLAVLIRPVNAVITLCFFLLDAKSLRDVAARFRYLFRLRPLVTFAGLFLLVWLPQLIYWKYAWGSFLHYSYGGERFTNLADPVLLPLWFSPLNGLFLYNPLALFLVAGAVLMLLKRRFDGLLMMCIFLLVSYISGSWHMWYFGGSYGARPFTEYFALLSPGLAVILEELAENRGKWLTFLIRPAVTVMLLLCVWYNLALTVHNQWNTGSVWDWDGYRERLRAAGLTGCTRHGREFCDDFENISSNPGLARTTAFSSSYNTGALVDARYPYCMLFERGMGDLADVPVRQAGIEMMVNPVYGDTVNALLVASIEDAARRPWSYASLPLSRAVTRPGWNRVRMDLPVPLWLNDPEFRIRVYLWKRAPRTFAIDDVAVSFH